MTEVLVVKYFGNSDDNSTSFKIFIEKGRIGPHVKVLNRGMASFEGIGHKLAKVVWGWLFAGKGISSKSDIGRVKEQHVPARVNWKFGSNREPWLMRGIKALVGEKKEVFIR